MKQEFVVYGAGEWGSYALDLLGNDRVLYFVDRDFEKVGKQIKGKIIKEYTLSSVDGKNVIIAISKESAIPEISDSLTGARTILSIQDWVRRNQETIVCSCKNHYKYIIDEMINEEKNSSLLCINDIIYHFGVWHDFTMQLVAPICEMLNNCSFDCESKTMVDMGAGFGFWSVLFRQKSANVIAVDKLDSRYHILKRLSEHVGGMTALNADIMQIKGLSNACCDASYCMNTLHVVEKYTCVLDEMIRITKDGGICFFVLTNPENIYIREKFSDSSYTLNNASKENVDKHFVGYKKLYEKELFFYNGLQPSHHLLCYKIFK